MMNYSSAHPHFTQGMIGSGSSQRDHPARTMIPDVQTGPKISMRQVPGKPYHGTTTKGGMV